MIALHNAWPPGRSGREARLSRLIHVLSSPAMAAILAAGLAWAPAGVAAQAPFLVPAGPDAPPVFGVPGGIVVAFHPATLDDRRDGGPRGLVRVGLHDPRGGFTLVNYIAVEPVVLGGKRGGSELELGADGRNGLRFALRDAVDASGPFTGARITGGPHGRQLSLAFATDQFANGARPIVEVTLFADLPDRVRFRLHTRAGSATIRRLTLSATMGNQIRARHLWLRDGIVDSLRLYEGYRGDGFVERQTHPLARLQATPGGDMAVALTSDEADPSSVMPAPNGAWRYRGPWLTQFWLKPRGTFDESLHARVNGRHIYWGGRLVIPGGVSFENFELREDYVPGQEIWFGLSRRRPEQLFGFANGAPPLRR